MGTTTTQQRLFAKLLFLRFWFQVQWANFVDAVNAFWKSLRFSLKQLVLFAFAEALLIGFVIIQLASMDGTLRAISESRAISELNLLQITYGTKIDELKVGLHDESRNPAFIRYLESRDPNDYKIARNYLIDEIKEREIEFLVILDKTGKVVVGGLQNKTGQIFDPSGVSSQVIGTPIQRITRTRHFKVGDLSTAETVHHVLRHHPAQVVRSTLIPYSLFKQEGAPVYRERKSEFSPITVDHMFDTQSTGLVRYVASPIFQQNTSLHGRTHESLLGVLIAGDVVNGKVPIVEQVTRSFSTGYSAVWYDMGNQSSGSGSGPDLAADLPSTATLQGSTATSDTTAAAAAAAAATSSGRFRQAVSYIGLMHGSVGTALAGFSLHDEEYLTRVAGSAQPVLRRLDILKQTYTMAGKRLPNSPAMLVRGTSDEMRQATLAVSLGVNSALVVACILVDTAVLVATLRRFTRPLDRIRAKVARHRARGAGGAGGSTARGGADMLDLAKMADDPISVEELPTERSFHVRGAATNLVVALTVAAMLVVQQNLLSDALVAMSRSEINVVDYLYDRKPEELRLVAQAQAKHKQVVDALQSWERHRANPSAHNMSRPALVALRDMLQQQMSVEHVELGMLLDRNARIIASANGEALDFRSGEFMDPAHVVTDIIDSPQQIIMASVLENELYLADEPKVYYESVTAPDGHTLISGLDPASSLEPALVRWVGVPVFLPSTTAAAKAACVEEAHADAVLLYGDIMNGKLGLPARVGGVMGQGYTAVYQYDAVTHTFSLATSILTSGDKMESDIELGSQGLLLLKQAQQEGRTISGKVRLSGHHVEAEEYTLVVQNANSRVVVDSFGHRQEAGEVAAFLIRGSPAAARGIIQQKEVELYVFTIAALVLTVCLRTLLTWLSYRPARHLIRSLIQYGFLEAASTTHGSTTTGTSGTSSSKSTSKSTSSSGSSDSDTGSGAHSHAGRGWRGCVRRIRHFRCTGRTLYGRRTFQTTVLVMVLASLSQLLLVSFVDLHPMTEEQAAAAAASGGGSSDGAAARHAQKTAAEVLTYTHDMFEFIQLGGAYLHQTQKERSITALMVASGWDAALQTYRHHVEDVRAQQTQTNARQVAVNKALAALNPDEQSAAWVALSKQGKRLIHGLRAHRLKVAAHGYARAEDSTRYITRLNDALLRLLFSSCEPVRLSAPFRLVYSYLVLAGMQEFAELEIAATEASLVHGSFATPLHYRETVEDAEEKLVFKDQVFMQIAPDDSVHAFQTMVSADLTALTNGWEALLLSYPDVLESPPLPSPDHYYGNMTALVEQYYSVDKRMGTQLDPVMDREMEKEAATVRVLAQEAIAFAVFALYLGYLRHATRHIRPKHMRKPLPKKNSAAGNGGKQRSRSRLLLSRLRRLRKLARWLFRVTARLQFMLCTGCAVGVVLYTVLSSVATMLHDVAQMNELSADLEFATAGGDMLHQLQLEMSLTEAVVGSNYTHYRAELQAQWPNTDATIAPVLASLPRLKELSLTADHTPWVSHEQLLSLEQELHHVMDNRGAVSLGLSLQTNSSILADAAAAAGLNAHIAIAPYVHLAESLGDVLDSFSHLAHDGHMLRLIQAYIYTVLGKEAEAHARAEMSAILEQHSMNKKEYRLACELHAREKAFRFLYNVTVPSELRGMYDSEMRGEEVFATEHWWLDLLTFPSSVEQPRFPSIDHWLGNSSVRLDALHRVELRLQALLVGDTERIQTQITTAIAMVVLPQVVCVIALFVSVRLFFAHWRHRMRKRSKKAGKTSLQRLSHRPRSKLVPSHHALSEHTNIDIPGATFQHDNGTTLVMVHEAVGAEEESESKARTHDTDAQSTLPGTYNRKSSDDDEEEGGDGGGGDGPAVFVVDSRYVLPLTDTQLATLNQQVEERASNSLSAMSSARSSHPASSHHPSSHHASSIYTPQPSAAGFFQDASAAAPVLDIAHRNNSHHEGGASNNASVAAAMLEQSAEAESRQLLAAAEAMLGASPLNSPTVALDFTTQHSVDSLEAQALYGDLSARGDRGSARQFHR